MKAGMRGVLTATIVVLLAGCGGGGGGGGGGDTSTSGNGTVVTPPVSNDPGLQLTPSTINLSLYAGESQQVDVGVQVMHDFPGVVNVRVKDDAGVIRTPVDIRSFSKYFYTATLHVSEALPAGVYDGMVQISLCKDDPAVCAQPYQGSPWRLPYHIELKNFGTALTQLAPVAAMADWGMYQGGVAHTGYAPLTIDAARITPRFSMVAPDAAKFIQPSHSAVQSVNGVAYFTRNASLYAVSEQTGAVLWKNVLSNSPYGVGDPSVYQGVVFVPVSDGSQNGVQLFNAVSGALIRIVPATDASLFISPTVDATSLYIRANGGALNVFDYTSGAFQFQQSNKYSSMWMAPYAAALDQNYVYFYNAGTIFQLDKRSGVLNASMRTFRDQYNDSYANNIGSVVLHSDQQALMTEEILYGDGDGTGTLFNFDFAAKRMAWSVPGTFHGNPVVNGGKLYIANNTAVVAMRLQDGGSEWTWPIPAEEVKDGKASAYNLIVTDNTLFASFSGHVYAIDLASHKTIWSFPRGGQITMSRNGILYVAGASALYAFNLK